MLKCFKEDIWLKVEVIFICHEIVGELRNGIYEVPVGTDILELLKISSAECNVQILEDAEDKLLFLVNGKSVQPDAKLSAGDKVYVLRQIFGG
jgi:sulfur carrier protein ThiS